MFHYPVVAVTLVAVAHQEPIALRAAEAQVAVVVMAVAVLADAGKINLLKTYIAVLLLNREDFFCACQFSQVYMRYKFLKHF
jgi:hypothetical protein